MLLEYINAAMERARYDLIKDDEPYYGEIPDIQGAWATGHTLEECRRHLATAVEDWLLFSISSGAPISPVGDVQIVLPRLVV